MGKARNLSVLLAADGQVEDAKIDGLTSSKLTGDLPALSAANLTSIPAANITGTLPAISGANLTGVVAVSGVATDATKLPLAGGALTGAVTTNSTFDGRDVAADGVTADAALPKAGGAMTGAITTNSTFDGRDVGVDGTKLDGIEANATADLTNEEIQDVVGGMVTSNTESGITVTYQDSDGTLDFVVASQTDENFTTADHSKLDGIEANATADQTGAQIKTAYEAESNAFTDAQFTKLSNIETAATADQTAAQIKTAYESNSNTNAYNDAAVSKLAAIEASATADQTNTEIRDAVEAASDSNTFTDADHTKLNAIEALADVTDTLNVTAAGALMDSELAGIAAIKATTGTFLTADQTKLDSIEASADVTDTANVVSALSAGTGVSISGAGVVAVTAVALTTVQTAANQTAHLALTAQEGDIVVRSDENKTYCHNGGSAGTMADYTLLATPTDAVLSVNGNTGAITAAHIATAVEAASNSNTFTDADHTKLNAIEASATADQTAAQIKTAYESNSDTNEFSDAEQTKLAAAATLTGTETLTNKTITAATLSGTHTAASTGTKIIGSPTGISEATLELNTDSSGWNKNQIMFSDSNDKVGTFSGSKDSTRYKTIQTLDPNHNEGSTLTVAAGSFVATKWYKIASVGTTDFTAIGASANTVGTNFQPNVTTNAGSFVIGTQYKITSLGNTTQAQWNTAAGTSGDTYAVDDTFEAAATGTGTGTVVYTPTTTNLGAGTGTATIQSYAGDHAIYFTKNYTQKNAAEGIRMEMNMWGSGSQGAIMNIFGDYTQHYGIVPLKLNASKTQILNELLIEGPGAEASISMYEDETNGTNKIQLKVPASIASDVILTLPAATDTLVGKATTDTLTNKTLTSPVINTGVSGSAILDSDTMSGASATTLASSESIKAYVDALDALPSQSGNSGKFLTTNATTASWATVDALPAQSGNAGKYLTTDATNASWATLDTDSNTTTKGLYEHSHTISSNYAITAGNNALAAGPITINTGITVTVPSGSTWVIA